MIISHFRPATRPRDETVRFRVGGNAYDRCVVRRAYRRLRRQGLDAYDARATVVDVLGVGVFWTTVVDRRNAA